MGDEAPIEDGLVKGCKARGGWAAKMIDKGRRGAPDRECRFPGPLTVYVETKAPLGKLASWQAEYHDDLRSLGYTVKVIWTHEQLAKFFWEFDAGFYA